MKISELQRPMELADEQVLRLAPMAGNFTDDEVVAFCAGVRRGIELVATMLADVAEPIADITDAGSMPFGERGGWVCLADGGRDLILDGQFSLDDLERIVATLRGKQP